MMGVLTPEGIKSSPMGYIPPRSWRLPRTFPLPISLPNIQLSTPYLHWFIEQDCLIFFSQMCSSCSTSHPGKGPIIHPNAWSMNHPLLPPSLFHSTSVHQQLPLVIPSIWSLLSTFMSPALQATSITLLKHCKLPPYFHTCFPTVCSTHSSQIMILLDSTPSNDHPLYTE